MNDKHDKKHDEIRTKIFEDMISNLNSNEKQILKDFGLLEDDLKELE